jgi:hypothetical protein
MIMSVRAQRSGIADWNTSDIHSGDASLEEVNPKRDGQCKLLLRYSHQLTHLSRVEHCGAPGQLFYGWEPLLHMLVASCCCCESSTEARKPDSLLAPACNKRAVRWRIALSTRNGRRP